MSNLKAEYKANDKLTEQEILHEYPPRHAVLKWGDFEMLYTLPGQVKFVDVPTEFGMMRFKKTDDVVWRGDDTPHWLYKYSGQPTPSKENKD